METKIYRFNYIFDYAGTKSMWKNYGLIKFNIKSKIFNFD